MKQALLACITFFFGGLLLLNAQVVITSEDMPMPGQMWVNATDTSEIQVDVGTGGANQSWELTGTADLIETIFIVEPDTTPWYDTFPEATIAVGLPGGGYNYMEITMDQATSLGFGVMFPVDSTTFESLVLRFTNPQTIAVFPAQMGVSFVDTSSFEIGFSGDGINFDSVRLKSTTVDSVVFDGWGMLTTPNGTLPTLRSTTYSTSYDSTWVYVFGVWLLVDAQTIPSVSWAWYAKETHGPAATVSLNFDSIYTVSWSVLEYPPIAQFSFEDQGNGQYQFTNNSLNANTFTWNFGDGTTSTDSDPMHTYTTPGDYMVCLIATNDTGSDTTCMNITVVLPPSAAFTYTDQGGGAFQFTDQSTNEPDTWLWDFGDGSTSTEQNPTYTYSSSGNYEVCLAVSNSAGSDTTCQTVNVVVTGLTEAWQKHTLALFPNPVSDVLQIRIDWNQPLQLVLYDLLGQHVRMTTFTQQAQISVADLPKGSYVYTLRTPEGELVARGHIIVMH